MFGTGCLKIQYYFLKWPLQTFLTSYKNFNFSNYCKAHQYIRLFIDSGHFLNYGHKNGGPKSGYKMDFKEELFKIYFFIPFLSLYFGAPGSQNESKTPLCIDELYNSLKK